MNLNQHFEPWFRQKLPHGTKPKRLLKGFQALFLINVFSDTHFSAHSKTRIILFRF